MIGNAAQGHAAETESVLMDTSHEIADRVVIEEGREVVAEVEIDRANVVDQNHQVKKIVTK